MGINRDNEKNVNEPGVFEDRPYYDDKNEKEELEKIPVEYLGLISKRKEGRFEKLVFWLTFWIVILGFGPGTQGQEFNPQTGELKTYYTFAWGLWEYKGVVRQTDWTEWYLSKTPESSDEHWVPYGAIHPALFGHLKTQWRIDLGWEMPPNILSRMKELDEKLRPGMILEVPRILNAVNNAREWNAIMVPLCTGDVDEAYEWWDDHKDELLDWSREPKGTPLSRDFIWASLAYVEEMQKTDEYLIPLMPSD
ncbi:hypothetical protein KAU08_08045 [bacterium]|nr:hypothetical protein [bacterium]